MKLNHNFSILALDGGGVRGIYGARILARLEATLGAQVKDCFDLFAGVEHWLNPGRSRRGVNSHVGNSAALRGGVAAHFQEAARHRRPCTMLWRSRYSQQPLDDVLQRYVPDLTIGELSTPLLIPSTDLATGRSSRVQVALSGRAR